MARQDASWNALWRFSPRPLSPRLPWEASAPDPLRVSAEGWAAALGLAQGLPARPLPAAAADAPEPVLDLATGPSTARRAAERRWVAIAMALGKQCTLGGQIAALKADERAIEELVADTFGTRADSTLARRGIALQMFVRWLRRAGGTDQPITEPLVYEYLVDMRHEGAPATRAQSFLEALRFAGGLVGLSVPVDLCSARVRGAAARAYSRLRARRPAVPLTVDMVRGLEMLVVTAPSLATRFKAGVLCFALHARGRASEVARCMGHPLADLVVASSGRCAGGFLEYGAGNTKTATGRRRRLVLPLVAPALGVAAGDAVPWGAAWRATWAEAGLTADRRAPLLPASGLPRPGAKPAGAAEVTRLLRSLLVAAGFAQDVAKQFTSHSLKATTLSWAAKAGMPMSSRRPLGGHCKADEAAPRAYSRDELAAPLRRLAAVYADIRCGVFEPDHTRSGMMKPAAGGEADADENSDDHQGGATSTSTSSASSASSSSASSGGSGDEGNDEVFLVGAASLVKHAVGVKEGFTACGREASGFKRCFVELPVCQRCTAALLRAEPAGEPDAKKTKRAPEAVASGSGSSRAGA